MINGDDKPLFSFVILGDTHITDEEGKSVDQHTTRTVAGKFDALLDKIATLEPAFVIHLGDITHPGPLSGDYPNAADEFFAMTSRIKPPWYLVPGNHDIGEKLHRALPELDETLSISERSIARYQQNFGPQYQSFEHENCVFILINSLLINSGLPDEPAQWYWLEHTLGTNLDKRLFVCSHYPMFLSAENEADHYDNIGQPGRARLAELMRTYGVEGFYSGHVHNFFYNRLDEMHHFTLPSTSILRHDYLEFFRTQPDSREMGRYDPAKTGFFWINVYEKDHIPHLLRQSAPDTARTHAWRNTGGMPEMDLRMPWCERQEVSSPWGAEIFERKRVRNDYPLSALWEMGIRDLRIPVSDLEEPETARRVRDLAALGHRFTPVMFGPPDAARRDVLVAHANCLKAIEVVALRDMMPAFCDDLRALRAQTGRPIFLNPTHAEVQGYTSTHGIRMDHVGDLEWLQKQTALRDAVDAVDGVVFGVPQSTHPLEGLIAAQDIAEAYDLRLALHIQNVGMYRTTVPDSASARLHELNRVAEAAILARASSDARDAGQFHGAGPRVLPLLWPHRPALQSTGGRPRTHVS